MADESEVVHYIRTLYGFPFVINNITKIEDGLDGELTEVKMVHKRYVGLEDVDLWRNDVIVVKSPMGSGKTTLFLELCKMFSRVLVVSCRRSYSDFISSTIPGMKNYQDIRGPISASEHPKCVCQVQSLRRIKDIATSTIHAQWQMLYIDEPDGVFKEIISGVSDLSERKKGVHYLVKLFSCVPKVVVTDAGLAPWHLRIMRSHLLSSLAFKRISCLVNTWVPATHSVRIYQSCLASHSLYSRKFQRSLKKVMKEQSWVDIDNHLMGRQNSVAIKLFVDAVTHHIEDSGLYEGDITHRLVHLVRDSKDNAVVICNTKAQANLIHSLLVEYVAEDELCLLTGNTAPDKRKAILKDPKSYLQSRRAFIYTTAFKVGIDLNFPHFHEVFLIVDSLSVKYTPTVIDLYQSIGRSRQSRLLNVYITNNKVKPSRIPEMEFEPPTKDHVYPIKQVSRREDMDRVVYRINRVERELNSASSVFKDALLRLLSETITRDLVDVPPPPEEVEKEMLENPEILHRMKVSALQVFQERIARFTTLTLDSFNVMYHDRTPKDRKTTLEQIGEAMGLVDGSIRNALYVVRNLNKHLLKQWTCSLGKSLTCEHDPSEAVDMLNYDEEVAALLNPDDLMDSVYRQLYKINKFDAIRDFESFKWVVDTLCTLLDRPPSARFELTDDLKRLSRVFIGDYYEPQDPFEVVEAVTSQTGLIVHKGHMETYSVIMPVRKSKIDIHKMASILLV